MLTVHNLDLAVPGRTLLTGFSLSVARGESVAVVGPSGCGKTTLLNAIAGLHQPERGEILIDSEKMWNLGEAQRAGIRLKQIGFVFQFGELLPELNVVENVSVPLRLAGVNRHEALRRSHEELARLDLEALAAHDVASLSGGERQRVAVARALVHGPALLLADEPTGSLDEDNVKHVTRVITSECRERGVAALVATHDALVARGLDRVVYLRRQSADEDDGERVRASP